MVNNPYLWSTTAGNNSNVDGINWSEGMAASAVNNSARQEMASAAAFIKDIAGGLAAGGSANALTLTANATFDTLANGLIVSFRAAADNTGSATLNVNSIGAKQIRKATLTGIDTLAAGDIQEEGIYVVQYSTAVNGGAGGWLLLNPTNSPVVGSSTDNAIARYDGTLGLLQNSGATIDDSANLTADSFISADGVLRGTATQMVVGTLGPTGDSGTVFLRPQGFNSSTGQTTIASSGAMTISGTVDASGVIQHGTYSASGATVGAILTSNANAASIRTSTNATGAQVHAIYNNPNGQVGSITTSGSATTFNTSSDKRLKEDWQPFDAGYIIDRIEVWSFAWKKDGARAYGVLAQDCADVFADAVLHDPMEDFWGVDYSKFVPLLLQEVKDLRRRMAAQEQS